MLHHPARFFENILGRHSACCVFRCLDCEKSLSETSNFRIDHVDLQSVFIFPGDKADLVICSAKRRGKHIHDRFLIAVSDRSVEALHDFLGVGHSGGGQVVFRIVNGFELTVKINGIKVVAFSVFLSVEEDMDADDINSEGAIPFGRVVDAARGCTHNFDL